MNDEINPEDLQYRLQNYREVSRLLDLREKVYQALSIHAELMQAFQHASSESRQSHVISVFNEFILEINTRIGKSMRNVLLRSTDQIIELVSRETDQEEGEDDSE